MANIGKLLTFPSLFKDVEDVVIPKVQRDYAYGREEERVKNILRGLLGNILDAVKDENGQIILDFIYGGPSVKVDEVTGGMIPLDGQQRLTTLYLLYFYASLLEGGLISEEDFSFLKHFSYETRQSANEFCHHLITDIRADLLQKKYNAEKDSIKDFIIDDAHYLMTYGYDPTVKSMLNVLDVIEKMCREKGMNHLEPSLWTRLMTWNNIKFYALSLDDFGLTDDLYIKMNSRGKRLTSFEIFKADVMAAIKDIDEENPDTTRNLKDEFSKKTDAKWIDIVWNSISQQIDDPQQAIIVTSDADSKYFWLFKNIFWLEYCLEGKNTKENKNIEEVKANNSDYIKDILCDRETVIQVIDIFDTLHEILVNQGFSEIWGKYFYESSDVLGEDNKIRLFGRRYNNVFEAAMQTGLTVPYTVYFYSFYLLAKCGYSYEEKFKCMRTIRNLMVTNVRLEDARTDKLPGFLKEAKYVIDHKGIDHSVDKDNPLVINGEEHRLAFVQNGWNEEFAKQNCLSSPETYDKLLKYENNDLLRTSVSLFMYYCGLDKDSGVEIEHMQFDEPRLLELLDKFEKVFSNNYLEYFDKIRVNLLNQDAECYLQWDANMEGNEDGSFKRRYIISAPWLRNYRQFFIRYANRRNQNAMLKILENIPLPDKMKESSEKCKEFDNEDWRYYLAKYPAESNYRDSRYGMVIWENRNKRPLELIVLNSSQHGANNLEWMMMNLILFNKLNNHNDYKLDPHGCSSVVITADSSSLDFRQSHWIVKTNVNLKELIAKNNQITCDFSEEESTNVVSFSSENHDMDYVELGLYLVKVICSSIVQKDTLPTENAANGERNQAV